MAHKKVVTPATLPPGWVPYFEDVVAAQEGRCLLCGAPPTLFGIWEQPDGKAVPYALCGGHGDPPSQETLARVEAELADGPKGWDPLPAPADGPLGYTRALEEQLALARLLRDPKQYGALPHSSRTTLGRTPFFVAGDAGEPLDVIPTTLARAQPYYWSPPLCAMLQDLAPTVPLDWTLVPETLVTPAGFSWFASPITLPHGPPVVTSFAWCRLTVRADDCVVFTKFMSFPERRAGFPAGLNNWPFGMTLRDFLVHLRANTARLHAKEPLHVSNPTDEYPLADRHERAELVARCYAAAFALLEQRILIPHRKPIPRPVRRRATREATPPELPPAINVVVFRRSLYQHAPDRDGHAAVEWSCRWIVSGHWRQQWYPSLGRHRPIRILPHVKGPEDKPLRAPAPRIFAVVR